MSLMSSHRLISDSNEGKFLEPSPVATSPLSSASTALQKALFVMLSAMIGFFLIRVRLRQVWDPPWCFGSTAGILRPRPGTLRTSAQIWYQTAPSRNFKSKIQSGSPVLTRSSSPSPGKWDPNHQLILQSSSRRLWFLDKSLLCFKQSPTAASKEAKETGNFRVRCKVQTGAWIFPILTGIPENEYCYIFALDAESWLKEQLGPWSLKVLAEAQKGRICDKVAPVATHICGWFANPVFLWCGWYWYRDGFDISVADSGTNGKRRGGGSPLIMGDPYALV